MTSRGFLDSHPAYAGTSALDDLRAAEYGRLDAQGTVYLDYTGGGLHADSQVREHAALLGQQVFGNPHSASPSSDGDDRRRRAARAAVLDYFNGTGEYTAVFTLNASGALKLVGESYPFEPGGRLLLTVDNHNSVNGIREFARVKGASVDYAPLTVPELRIDLAATEALLAKADPSRANLFAFPAQSNFSGVKHPLALIDGRARARLARAGRRGGVRPDQPPRSARRVARFRRGLVLQDVRLPDRRRLPADPQRRARHAAAAVVCRRHRELRDRAGPPATCWRRARPGSRTAR